MVFTFPTSSQTTMNIVLSRYSTVNVYVLIPFCNSRLSFLLDGSLFGFFLLLIHILYCRWRTNYQEEQGWDPMNQFKAAGFLCLSRTMTWISNVICCGLVYFQ